MRSNDVMLGFGYDIFFFTLLQEMMATELGTRMGWYQHTVGSLHIYEQDCERAEEILSEPVYSDPPEMDHMTDLDSLPEVLRYERLLREPTVVSTTPLQLARYWQQILDVLLFYKLRREGDLRGSAIVAERLKDSPYLGFLSQ